MQDNNNNNINKNNAFMFIKRDQLVNLCVKYMKIAPTEICTRIHICGMFVHAYLYRYQHD